MRYFDLKDKKYYKVAKVLRETINIYLDYGKHIWIANGIKIIDILFMAFLFVKKRSVSIRIRMLHERVVVVIIVVRHCR